MTRSAARTIARPRPATGLIFGSLLIGAALALAPVLARAEDEIIHSYSVTTFGDPAKYGPDLTHLDYVNPDAPKGGEISFSADGTFDSLNPYATLDGSPGALSSSMYESVLTSTADEIGASYCLMCTEMEYPKTRDWVIFHLRPDVKFSDGTPLTAQDVAFSHNLLITQGTPSYASEVGRLIPKVEALDDLTVKFTFAEGEPKKGLIEQAGGTPVFSKALFDKTGARLDKARLETSPGSGPYMLDSYDVGKRIIYRRNPDYWGKDLPINKGRFNFDSIRVEYFADSDAAFVGFSAGEFTFRQETSSINWATAYDIPAVQKGWIKKVALPNGNLPAASGFVFNLRRPLFQNADLRRALGLMYNFTFTNTTLQYGLFRQRESFWQGSDLAAKGKPEGLELELLQSVADKIDPSILTEDAVMPHMSGDDQLDRGNLRAALALMEKAGYTTGDDGLLRNAKGEVLKIEFLETRPSFDRVIAPYIENLKKLGVDITYNRVDPAQYQARTQSFDYDMIYDGYVNGLEEGNGIDQRYGTKSANDIFNSAGYGSPAVDKLITDVVDATSTAEMAAGVRAIDRIMRRDYFIVPTWYNDKYWVAYFDMYEHPENLPPYALGQLDFWWYNAEKAEALKAAGALK